MSVPGFTMDPAYQDKVTEILWEALFLGLRDEESGRSILRTGDLVHIFTQFTALIISQSDAVSSPAKVRVFCDDLSKRLRRSILEAQASGGGLGWIERVTIPGEVH